MPLEKALYHSRVHITGGWKKFLTIHPLLRILFISQRGGVRHSLRGAIVVAKSFNDLRGASIE
jgi:hypothetical protein